MRRFLGVLIVVALCVGLPTADAANRRRAAGDTETVSTLAGPVTISASHGKFTRAALVEQPAAASERLDYPVGFFGFELAKLKKRQTVTVSFDLPETVTPETVVKCGPSGCAEFPASIDGSAFTVRLTDGGAGDSDGAANGRIVDPIAPAVAGCELDAGEVVVSEWTGEIAPMVFGVNEAEDLHPFELPATCDYESVSVRIEWDAFVNDLDLEVTPPTGDADKKVSERPNTFEADASESVSFADPAAGSYSVRTYGFLSAGTEYSGRATAVVKGPSNDVDLDGVANAKDNCETVFNPSQGDRDADGSGDVCDEPSPPLPAEAETEIFRAAGETGVSAHAPPIGPAAEVQDEGVTTSEDHRHTYTVPVSSHYADYSNLHVRVEWDVAVKDYLTLEVRSPAGQILTGIFVNTNYQEVSFVDPVPGEYLVTVRESRTTAGTFDVFAAASRETKPDFGPVPPIVSDPGRPRVVVADLDSAINPYHDFYYAGSEIYPDGHPSSMTQEVLDDLGVKPENVVTLTRTGNLKADVEADAAFWNRVQRGELYHFRGTNIVATSFAPDAEIPLKPGPVTAADPETLKNAHGVGTSAALLRANPDAVLLFVEQGGDLGSERSHRFAFLHPAVDMVTTSYGRSASAPVVGSTGFPLPEYRAFEHTHQAVVGMGKMHFSSGGNGPGVTPARAGAGPWWSIGVSGIEEGTSEGKSLLSGNFPDFVSDYTQDLPYCVDCEAGYEESVPGTSFSTPRAAGVASRVLLETRRKLGHAGGIETVDGKPVMAVGSDKAISNWVLRRALEQAAWIPDSTAYDPVDGVFDLVGVPINPVAPWLQTGWGDLTADPARGVVPAALAELGFDGARREKSDGYCDFQTTVIEERKLYWNEVAPLLPDPPVLLDGETPPGASSEDPFVYC